MARYPSCGGEADIEALKLELEKLRRREKYSLRLSGIGVALFILGICLVGFSGAITEWYGSTLYYLYGFIALLLIPCGLYFTSVCLIVAAYYRYKRSKLMESLKR